MAQPPESAQRRTNATKYLFILLVISRFFLCNRKYKKSGQYNTINNVLKLINQLYYKKKKILRTGNLFFYLCIPTLKSGFLAFSA